MVGALVVNLVRQITISRTNCLNALTYKLEGGRDLRLDIIPPSLPIKYQSIPLHISTLTRIFRKHPGRSAEDILGFVIW